jgi:hypothetical protein
MRKEQYIGEQGFLLSLKPRSLDFGKPQLDERASIVLAKESALHGKLGGQESAGFGLCENLFTVKYFTVPHCCLFDVDDVQDRSFCVWVSRVGRFLGSQHESPVGVSI